MSIKNSICEVSKVSVYPVEMPSRVKLEIARRSTYSAKAGLRKEKSRVYATALKRVTKNGIKNTTQAALQEMSKKYPERYDELRQLRVDSMIQAWLDSPTYDEPVVENSKADDKEKPVSSYCDPLGEQKSTFWSRLMWLIRG